MLISVTGNVQRGQPLHNCPVQRDSFHKDSPPGGTCTRREASLGEAGVGGAFWSLSTELKT